MPFFLKVVVLSWVSTLALFSNTIIFNANIYTQNEKQAWAEAMVYEDETILYVGSTAKALGYKHANSTLVNMQKRFVMPGFIDAHTHVAIASLLENVGVSLKGAKGKKEILERIKACKKKHPNLALYSGVGFYPYAFGPKGPAKEILDEIFPHSYAFFIANNGHSAWVNSKTLDLLNVTKDTPDPLPKIHYYYRDKQGNPTGFLVEGKAFWPHFKAVGLAKSQAFYDALESFLPKFSKAGITTLFDAGMPTVEKEVLQALQSLENKKKLPLRYYASYVPLTTSEAITALEDMKALSQKYNGDLFELNTLKFINDNADDDNFQITFREKS